MSKSNNSIIDPISKKPILTRDKKTHVPHEHNKNFELTDDKTQFRKDSI